MNKTREDNFLRALLLKGDEIIKLKDKIRRRNLQIKELKQQLTGGKYPLTYYRWLLCQTVAWLEDKPDTAEDLINFVSQADKEAMKDLLNLY